MFQSGLVIFELVFYFLYYYYFALVLYRFLVCLCIFFSGHAEKNDIKICDASRASKKYFSFPKKKKKKLKSISLFCFLNIIIFMYILSSTFRKMLFGWKLFAICVIIFSSNLGEQFSLFLAKKVQAFSRYCFLAFFFCIKFFFFFFFSGVYDVFPLFTWIWKLGMVFKK